MDRGGFESCYQHITILQHFFATPASAAGRTEKLNHGKEQFPETQLRKVLSNNSSIAAAYLQIREGSLTPGSWPVEGPQVLNILKLGRPVEDQVICPGKGL